VRQNLLPSLLLETESEPQIKVTFEKLLAYRDEGSGWQ
jgi:hypothetical protein